MSDDTQTLTEFWLYDIGRLLRSRLEALVEGVDAEDKRTSKRALRQVDQILAWLEPQRPLSPECRVRRAQEVLRDESLSVEDRLRAGSRAVRSKGLARGRPRTESSQYAIRALTLRYTIALSWRETALQIKGCAHERPFPTERSCEHCSEAIRNAAERLEKFLQFIDLQPRFPRHKKRDGMSLDELQALFQQTLS